MKKELKIVFKMVIMLLLAMAFISCASVPKESGFLSGYYDKLEPAPAGGGSMNWQKPGVDFAKYNKIILENVVYFFADDSEYKGIEPEQLQELSKAFEQEIINVYKDKYPIVSEPGPDVIRFKIALTGLKQSNPVISGVTTVIPIGLGVSAVKKGATGGWTGSGATNAELIFIDSVSNEIVSVAQGNYAAGFTERFSKYGSAYEAFKFWAKQLRAFTDQVKGEKQPQK